ncbi:hypothetical protein B0H14DRAFT_3451685 [Mycena olivaceomarginata]|nr:hypothetical protein B0H14DRAFT_3451685 [Mycena olivaceomarginata]
MYASSLKQPFRFPARSPLSAGPSTGSYSLAFTLLLHTLYAQFGSPRTPHLHRPFRALYLPVALAILFAYFMCMSSCVFGDSGSACEPVALDSAPQARRGFYRFSRPLFVRSRLNALCGVSL